jgi:uncharacterized membrane protein
MATPLPPQTPAPAAANTARPVLPRSVAAGNGAMWWTEAWRLFTPHIGVWLLIVVILFVISVVLALIPVVGHLANQVLYPVFFGGLMLGCRAIDRGQPLTVAHLFAGFSERAGPLLILGLLYTAIVIVITLTVAGILLLLFGAAVFAQLLRMGDPLAAGTLVGGALMVVLVGALLFLVLLLPLIMAIWFAPALVVLRGLEPWEAMRQSFLGCLSNVLPFLVYGLIGIVLATLATIPLGLGWLVVGPMTIASVYAGYCDIYEDTAVS